MLSRVNAAAKLRQAAGALGPLRLKLLEAAVLQDRSWRELGQLLPASDKTAKDYCVEAIGAPQHCVGAAGEHRRLSRSQFVSLATVNFFIVVKRPGEYRFGTMPERSTRGHVVKGHVARSV
jgi:hypothetical protein